MNDTSSNSLGDKLALAGFILALCFLSALGGMALWATETFPYQVVRDGVTTLKTLFPADTAQEGSDGTAPIHAKHNLNPIRFRQHGTLVRERERVAPGVTLLTSFWRDTKWRPGVRLVDIDGAVLHRWEVRPRRIWPFKDFPLGTYVHGSYLFPNGDLLVNVEYAGLARMDACGKILWKSDFATHHSVYRDEDGSFWVSGHHRIEKGDERASRFPPIKTPFGEDTLINVSPAGELLKEISLLEAFYDSPWRHLLWHYDVVRKPGSQDPLHLNDVETLSRELADDFPTLEAGDFVVSSRTLNAIAILNPKGDLEWVLAGEFTQQHDPDFEPGGRIAVFDNRYDLTPKKGNFLGGSRITAVDPATNEVEDLYNSHIGDKIFYTVAAGKHQLLENGNRLITEAKSGRIFEVTPAGETVWEWIAEPYNEKKVFEVLEGTRYSAITPQMSTAWPCHEDAS